mmetsp:Transcript_48279/g.95983  ORF Transcript_48279/g.95983 Transcript_48279/m.95983 type:complete len:141 (-) Transcript_48279:167-589(-)
MAWAILDKTPLFEIAFRYCGASAREARQSALCEREQLEGRSSGPFPGRNRAEQGGGLAGYRAGQGIQEVIPRSWLLSIASHPECDGDGSARKAFQSALHEREHLEGRSASVFSGWNRAEQDGGLASYRDGQRIQEIIPCL